MGKLLLTLFTCLTCAAQLPVVPVALTSGSGNWYPTNAAQVCFIWLDTKPLSACKTIGGTTLCADNEGAAIWTNIVRSGPGAGNVFTGVAGRFPTNFVSGGGANGTSGRLFGLGDQNRPMGSSVTMATFTLMIVANNTKSSVSHDIENLYSDGGGGSAPLIRYNDSKLEMSAGTLLSGANTNPASWHVITAVFNGASSSMSLDGIPYISGNAGATGMTGPEITFGNPFFGGNVSRFWGWTNVLSAGDTTSAINQCKKDFGIP